MASVASVAAAALAISPPWWHECGHRLGRSL